MSLDTFIKWIDNVDTAKIALTGACAAGAFQFTNVIIGKVVDSITDLVKKLKQTRGLYISALTDLLIQSTRVAELRYLLNDVISGASDSVKKENAGIVPSNIKDWFTANSDEKASAWSKFLESEIVAEVSPLLPISLFQMFSLIESTKRDIKLLSMDKDGISYSNLVTLITQCDEVCGSIYSHLLETIYINPYMKGSRIWVLILTHAQDVQQRGVVISINNARANRLNKYLLDKIARVKRKNSADAALLFSVTNKIQFTQ